MTGAWNPEYGRAYRERKRNGERSTYWNALTWEERFERKVDKSAGPDGCWLWIGAKDWRGYGIAQDHGRSTTAQRDVYAHLVGPIPPGFEIDHICCVRACVNPAHLRPLTHEENSRLASKPHGERPTCAKGHPYTEENTAPRVDHPGRLCKTCARQRSARHRSTRADVA